MFYNRLGEAAGRQQTLQGAPFAVPIVLLVAALLRWIRANQFMVWRLPLFAVLYAWGFIMSPRRKNEAGIVLLDLGHQAYRKGNLLFSGTLLLLGLAEAVSTFTAEGLQFDRLAVPLLWIMQSAIILQGTQRRNSVREHGLWFDNSFTRWDQMRAYHWEADRPNILTVEFTKPWL